MKLYLAKSELLRLLSARFLAGTFSLALLYFITLLLLPNTKLVIATIYDHFIIWEKVQFLILLAVGSLKSNPPGETSLILITALLVGINVTLFLSNTQQIRRQAHILFGGETLLGTVAAGCSSCGTSLLSVLAVGAGISIAPLQIIAIQVLAILLLLYSLFSSLTRLGVCRITR